MTLQKVKALTFDTGGTVLDWHSGFRNILAKTGKYHNLERDWGAIANDLRRRSLAKMLNLGENTPPTYNFDDAHRIVLDELCDENELNIFSKSERHTISWTTPHRFSIWPDFEGILPQLRTKFICCSFTILSFRIILDTAKYNNLSWDAVFSCEAIGKYKVLPEAYTTVARWLNLAPSEICMVACHNFDLDAARNIGFKTAFVHRPEEWGMARPPDPYPNKHHDIIINSFPELVQSLLD